MSSDLDRSQKWSANLRKRKLLKKQTSGLSKIGQRFVDRLTLSSGAGLWIESNITPLGCWCQDGRQCHGQIVVEATDCVNGVRQAA